jgi:hypothetical protein
VSTDRNTGRVASSPAPHQVFLDQLRAIGGGDLVNVSSVAGRVATAGFAT